MATNNTEPLDCPVSTKFTRSTFKQLTKISKNSKRYFGMSSVPVAEIVRVAVEEKLASLEAQAAQKQTMRP